MKFKDEHIELSGRAYDCLIATPEDEVTNRNAFFMPVHPLEVVNEPGCMVKQYAEGITNAGGELVFFDGGWNDLGKVAKTIRAGTDVFDETEKRVNSVVSAYVEKCLKSASSIILIGESKYGFAALLSMSKNPRIDAVAAILPVTYWPALREFQGMEANVLIRKYDLGARIEAFDGRKLFIEVNMADHRVREDLALQLAGAINSSYQRRGYEGNLTVNVSGSQGHVTSAENVDNVITWLKSNDYL